MSRLFALNAALCIVLIAGIVHSYRLNWKTRKTQKVIEANNLRSAAIAEDAEAINRRSAIAAKEAETINRRSTALLDQADAAWGNLPGWMGDDQEDEPRRQVDPWAEIHHPDQHQPAAIQRAGLPANLYQCQCGRQHQRPAPAPSITPPTGDNVVRAAN